MWLWSDGKVGISYPLKNNCVRKCVGRTGPRTPTRLWKSIIIIFFLILIWEATSGE